MPTWIALIRGINIGGKNLLPMKELVRDLNSLGLENVETYIQSGNVAFQTSKRVTAKLGDRIAVKIEERHGFLPNVFILRPEQLRNAIKSNPFPEAESEHKTLHIFFLASPSTAADIDSLNEAKSPSERFRLMEHVFYLHAPQGIGRSKLAANVERYLGVAATARNWRTVQKLWEMASGT